MFSKLFYPEILIVLGEVSVKDPTLLYFPMLIYAKKVTLEDQKSYEDGLKNKQTEL